jgi:hypothetical protein
MEKSKLNFTSDSSDVEQNLGVTVKHTLSAKDLDVLNFRIPPDSERFSDLNSILLKLQLKIVKADGTSCGSNNDPFLDWNGMHSLFSSCDIRFDGKVVSSMTAYPYTAALCRWLGASDSVRDVWQSLDGTRDPQLNSSDIEGGTDMKMRWSLYSDDYANSKTVTLWGRVYSDVLLSSRQYLPPNVELGIDLRRAPPSFSINCHSNGTAYKAVIDWASLYVKRLSVAPELVTKPLSTLKEDASIIFNRLESRIQVMPKGQSVWRWLDCLNGAPLPNRIYVGFITQEALYGKLTRYSTFFESLNLATFNVTLNGRDVMTDPIHTTYVKENAPTPTPTPPPTSASKNESRRTRAKRSLNLPGGIDIVKSDAREPYLALLEVFDQVKDQLGSVRLSYTQYKQGKSILALELSKCGQKSGSTGTMDLEVTRFNFVLFSILWEFIAVFLQPYHGSRRLCHSIYGEDRFSRCKR